MTTLQSAIEAELPNLRAEAEARMTSRATVRRQNGYTVVDGLKVPAWLDIYDGLPTQVAGADSGSAGTRTVTVGQTVTQVALRVAKFPATTTGLRDGDLIDVTEGENAGIVLRIVEASWQDQATARRVPVFEVQRPQEWP